MNREIGFKKICSALVILMMILISKTVFFGIVNRTVFQYIYYALSIAVLFLFSFHKKIEKKIITKALVLCLILMLNILIHLPDMTQYQINIVFSNILAIAVAAIVSLYIETEVFSIYYIKIMVFIAAISTLCFGFSNIFPGVAISMSDLAYDSGVTYSYSFFHTWGYSGKIIPRNAGPFWEPGAFQGFLLLALLMLLYETDKRNVRSRKMCLIILLVAILTTQSTTGYILTALILIFKWRNVKKTWGAVSNLSKIFFVIVSLTICGIILYSSSTIYEKLFSGESVSTVSRTKDLIGSFNLMIKSGIWGTGETAYKYFAMSSFGIVGSGSVGLFIVGYTYGIGFMICYLFFMISGIKKFFHISSFNEVAFLSVVFIILHLTEVLIFFPVYLKFLFSDVQKN